MQDYPAEFYDALHAGSPGDLDFYQKVCPSPTSVLELGCGSGRVLAALAAKDRRCVGVDLHPGLLALARAKQMPSVVFLQGDMLDLAPLTPTLQPAFDRIILPFCGLYCVGGLASLAALFANVARYLAPQGQFWLDAYSAETFHLDTDDPSPEQEPYEHPPIQVRGIDYRVFEQSRWNRSQQRILVSYLHAAVRAEQAAGAGLDDEVVTSLEHHYVLREQLEKAAQIAGLALTQAFGGFSGEAWHPETSWGVFSFAHAPGAKDGEGGP